MEVNSSGPVQGVNSVKQIQPTTEPLESAGQSSSISPQDEVAISPAAKLLDELNQTAEIQTERLAQIKAEIDAGTYETPEKLEIALERILHEIQVDE